ncbi:MAG: nucleotide exchange factor GrpE [Chloroflexota bacterium]
MADGERPDAAEPRNQQDGENADQPLSEPDALQQEVESLRGKVDAYLDLAQRTQADFANYKKRIEREREADMEIAQAGIVRSLLSILDDLDRAIAVAPTPSEGSFAEGVTLIHRKLQQWLEAHKVQRVDQVGEQFDPARHEAVAYEERPGFAEGQVASIMGAGYVMGDRVLRPAQVTVARGGSPETQSQEHSSMLQGGGE